MYSARYSCQILMKLEFSQKIFEIYSNIKFHEHQSGGSRVVPRGQTNTTKLIVAFRNSANTTQKVTTIKRLKIIRNIKFPHVSAPGRNSQGNI